MLLGQVVAISVGTNLFYLALVLAKRAKRPAIRSPQNDAPLVLWAAVLLSLFLVVHSPHTTDKTFLSNLLGMHALILVPLLPWPISLHTRCHLNIQTLYAGVAVIGGGMRLFTTIAAAKTMRAHQSGLLGFWHEAWATLYSHPAQSSIGWDVVWTALSFIVWLALTPLDKPTAQPDRRQSPASDKSS